MKIILRIIVILLVAAIIAGGFYLAANNSSIASSGEGGQPPVMTNASGQTFQPTDRPEGRDGDASLAGSLSGVLVTLAEIAGITVLVSLIQKAYGQFSNRRLNPARQ